ncbi:MAG: metallophosphatase family protein [Chromatiaceae bacterium]|nr:metallophosphatase family protein [Chromatiaceae bacterium]
MKVAVLSDIQGNLPALATAVEDILAWDPDLVVMAGDLVNRGPDSRGCLERFDTLRRSRGWLPVAGNHEVWVLRCGQEPPADALAAELRAFADWTFRQVADLIERLAGWPDHLCFHDGGADTWVHVTHGTLAGNRDGISQSVPDQDLMGKLPSGVALFVTAHTHKPLKRRLGGTEILNVGSVGSPFDGDPRASYGRLELRGGCWHTHILRLAYDREESRRRFEDSGFLDQGGPLARILYEEWWRARLLLPGWKQRYIDAVRSGGLSLTAAVDDFLAGLD